MFPFSRRRNTDIRRLDRTMLEEIVLLFERRYEEQFGTPMPSVEFYTRYRAGEIDETWAMAWASYYEALMRASGHREVAVPATENPRPEAVELVNRSLPDKIAV